MTLSEEAYNRQGTVRGFKEGVLDHWITQTLRIATRTTDIIVVQTCAHL